MKTLLVLCVFLAGFGFAFNTPTPNDTSLTSKTEQLKEGYFKLKNDTNQEHRIHTGSGVVTLYKGNSTSIKCEVGRKIYTAPKGVKDDLIFKVESNMCGKTIYLSDHL